MSNSRLNVVHAADDLSPLGLTYRQWGEALQARFGKGRAHARDAYRLLYTTGSLSAEKLAGLEMWAASPRLRAAVGTQLDVAPAPIVERIIEGETIKFRQQLADGRLCESVLIPMRFGHTLCISSQVGCRMGCTFCQTAQMGLVRNLTPAEIVGQVVAARFFLGAGLSGPEAAAVPAHTAEAPIPKKLVFMGMGEPMDNFDAVAQAIRVICDADGLAMKFEHVTVSTVGRVDGIRRLGELMQASRARQDRGFQRVNLAVSINAADDARRSQIMPINKATPLAELREAIAAFPKRPGAAVLLQYVLFAGFNDRPEDADRLAEFVRGLRAAINVIPWNPIDSPGFAPPTADQTLAFVQALRERGCYATARVTKGQRIMAACGQLGNGPRRVRKARPAPAAVSVP